MQLINTNAHPLTLKVKRANGADDFIHLAARGKAHLADGLTVDSNWLHTHGAGVRVINDTQASQAASMAVRAVVTELKDE